jgi:pilus assembly protein TadC
MQTLDRVLTEYNYYLKMAQLKTKAENWIPLSILAGVLVLTAAYFVILFSGLAVSPIIALAIGFAVTDLMLGYPYLKTQKKLEQIEEVFPEALKQMADTLRTGGTYEYALREVATSEYGALTEEMNLALRKMNEGENLESGLRSMASNIHSKNVQRVINIIIDSVKAGAGLADVLEEISEDVRQMNRVQRERQSMTLMQVLFILIAGAIIAPAILGIVTGVVELLISSTSTLNLSAYDMAMAQYARDTLFNLLQFYLFVEILASAVLIAIMHDGKAAKAVLYGPILVLVGFVVYYLSLFMARGIMGLG